MTNEHNEAVIAQQAETIRDLQQRVDDLKKDLDEAHDERDANAELANKFEDKIATLDDELTIRVHEAARKLGATPPEDDVPWIAASTGWRAKVEDAVRLSQ